MLINFVVCAALAQMGYRFSPTFVNNLLVKYDARGRNSFIVQIVENG
jgi:hypothetical protein